MRICGLLAVLATLTGLVPHVRASDGSPFREGVPKGEVRDPRPLGRVGQILIVGNVYTRQDIILRRVPLYPGAPLTRDDLRQAEWNLARLRLFARVRSLPVGHPKPGKGFKDVLIIVEEDATTSFINGVIDTAEFTRTWRRRG
jgi:hypothetical protein